ncbi:MAG: hypothetical protein P8188_15300 [Gemmatimonadota bacterium]|jgi:hypothetical protein
MNRSILHFVLFVTISAWAVSPLAGQTPNFGQAEEGRYHMTVSFGLDPAVISSLEVTRWTGVGNRVMGLSVEATLPVAEPDMHDYRAGAGASLALARFGTFHVAGRLGLSARGTRNYNFTAHGFGADLTAFLGHYGRRTFAAIELGYDKSLLEHIEHRETYLANYPGAVDGWYKAPAGTLRLGITTGLSFRAMGLGLRAYLSQSEGREDLVLPFGTSLSISYRF